MAMAKPRDQKNLVVGLDIGTSKIVAIVAELKPEGGRIAQRASRD